MKVVSLFFVCLFFLEGKEVFLPQHIHQYLNKKNPFYYQAIGEQYIAKGRELFSEGSLDTQLNASYDNKNYPTTSGTYEEVELLKPIENGIEFSVGYRKAEGLQEFNNIQTGQNGEIISSIKVPLLSVLYDISKNKVDIQSARLGTVQSEYQSKYNLLNLYFNITKIYYQVLLQNQLKDTQKRLLHKAKKTHSFIAKQVQAGQLPSVADIEIRQLILGREQQYIYEKNNFNMVQNIFLQYLGVEKKDFSKMYKLPMLGMKKNMLLDMNEAIRLAIENRPDLKVIDVELEKLALKKEYNNLEQYPKFDMKFSGVYDPINKEGYKVSLNFNFPLERRKYSGMDEVLQKKNLMIQNQKLKSIRELETSILNIYQKIKTKKMTIKLLKKELLLVKKLESVEIKKLHEGIGNLMFLNQREIVTLKVEQKLLKEYYELATYFLEVNYLLGKH